MYDPDLEFYNTSLFLKFYSALGCINLPKREKYQPEEFTDIFSKPEIKSTSCNQLDNFPKDGTIYTSILETKEVEEMEIETIILDGDLSPDEAQGEQEYPLPMLIAWEFTEEDEPKFFYLGYNWKGKSRTCQHIMDVGMKITSIIP